MARCTPELFRLADLRAGAAVRERTDERLDGRAPLRPRASLRDGRGMFTPLAKTKPRGRRQTASRRGEKIGENERYVRGTVVERHRANGGAGAGEPVSCHTGIHEGDASSSVQVRGDCQLGNRYIFSTAKPQTARGQGVVQPRVVCESDYRIKLIESSRVPFQRA